MFHVEHMFIRPNSLILILFLSAFIASCNKPDPHPEKSDSIYNDLMVELDISQKNLQAEEKQLESIKKDMALVTPQTGQIKGLQKKFFESQNNLDLYKQRLKYFEIKLSLREHYVKQRYNESINGGRAWPDEKENADYKIRMKLLRDKLNWGKPKSSEENTHKKENVPRGTNNHNKKPEKDSEH